MVEIDQATFFDKRIFALVSKILNRRAVTGINERELLVISLSDEVIALDRALDRGIIKELDEVKSFIPATDALLFMIKANRIGELDEALDVFAGAISEEKHLDAKTLQELLKAAKETPMSWATVLIGENKEDRYDEPQPQKSSIDLNDLRNRMR